MRSDQQSADVDSARPQTEFQGSDVWRRSAC